MRLPGDVTGRATRAAAAAHAVRGVLLARLLQLGAESDHLHHLQPRLPTSVSQDPLRQTGRPLLTHRRTNLLPGDHSPGKQPRKFSVVVILLSY